MLTRFLTQIVRHIGLQLEKIWCLYHKNKKWASMIQNRGPQLFKHISCVKVVLGHTNYRKQSITCGREVVMIKETQAALVMKFRFVFWDILPCKIIVNRRIRGTCCLHHQGDEYIPEDKSELHTRRRENLKSHTALVIFLTKINMKPTNKRKKDFRDVDSGLCKQ
jgi:hypothetical protein